MQRNTGYFPTESLEPCGNRLFSRSALNEGYLFSGSQRLFQKLEQEYLAYLEPLRSAAPSELLEKAGEIADTQAVYRCLCENTGLSTEQKEKLATLEQPLQAIRDRWRQTHPTPEPELLEACEALTTSQQQSEETPALSMTL